MGDKLELFDLEDGLQDLEAGHERVTAFAREKERDATDEAYRSENGGELADDDDSNMAEVAAIDGFDEEDHELEEASSETIGTLGTRVEACDEDTDQETLKAISADIVTAKEGVIERAKTLGFKGDLF